MLRNKITVERKVMMDKANMRTFLPNENFSSSMCFFPSSFSFLLTLSIAFQLNINSFELVLVLE